MSWRTSVFTLALVLNSSLAQAVPIFYADRASFLGAVGPSITDGYSAYTPTPETPAVLTNAEMSAVLGETSYESLSFQDLNLVGDVYVHGDGTNYCAGCNGNFRLTFDNTSLAVGGGVFGVAVDIVLHTARRSAIGDVIPGDRVADGTVLVEFTDGTVDQVTVPADIGFFGPETFFLGLTDDRGIKSLTVGIEPIPQRHRWVIDNLTIAAPISEPVPLDHFLCYEVAGDDVDVTVSLEDQFGVEPAVEVEEPELFCNPVDKNNEGIGDPTAHLTAYEIEDDDEEVERLVVVANQFGEQTLEVKEPKLLFVPSDKDGMPSDLNLDHFKCYGAEEDDVNVTVDLADQFGVEPQVLVKEPELFCNPVDKNGEGIGDPTAHLTCYEIEGDGEESEREVLVENQFGEQFLEVEEPEFLCVPSEKLSVQQLDNGEDDDDDGDDGR